MDMYIAVEIFIKFFFIQVGQTTKYLFHTLMSVHQVYNVLNRSTLHKV